MSGGGALSVESKRDLQAIVNGTFTKLQLLGVVGVLTTDAHNSSKSVHDQIKAIRDRMASARIPGGGKQPQAARPPLDSFVGH